MDLTKFMHLCPCFMKKGSFSGISMGKHSGWRTSLEMGPEPSGLQHWMPVALGLLSLDRGMHYWCHFMSKGLSPEHGSVGDVMVHELPPLHHVMGVQLTGGVHVRHDVDTDLTL